MKLYNEYDKIEVGIDEVGRGCLFGRVYSAAVILPKEIDEEDVCPIEIKDSKKLSAKNREILDEYIKHIALDYNISYQEPEVIDKVNILQATYRSMHQNIDNLSIDVDKILVDGNNFKPYYRWDDNGANLVPHECIIDGDNIYTPIAAASILAKVARDKYIEELCEKNPELDEKYNILSNKGYGAKAHILGIKDYGITDGHRKTFGICAEYS
tara:strand:- start:968 stop:1603 length:636 start_codon:yes stop_codon:yes gene_type:complete